VDRQRACSDRTKSRRLTFAVFEYLLNAHHDDAETIVLRVIVICGPLGISPNLRVRFEDEIVKWQSAVNERDPNRARGKVCHRRT